jgi:hypothetical protein
MSDTCRSCDAPIEWAITTKGSRIPLDVGLHDDGNIDVVDGIAHVVPVAGTYDAPPRRRSHFVTCPDAARFRHKGKR